MDPGRFRPRGSRGWQVGHLGFGLALGYRARTDQLAHVGSTVRSWTTGFGLAAVLRPSARLQLSPAVANTWYGAGGGIPDPLKMGKAFGRYVAPELAVDASDAGVRAAGLTALWSVRDGTGVWGSVRYLSLSPSGEAVSLPFQPEGTRSRWTAEVGMTVHPPTTPPRQQGAISWLDRWEADHGSRGPGR